MTDSSRSPRDARIKDFLEEFLAFRIEPATTYEPREDTFLILDALAQLSLRGLRVLDMGTGSGILAAYCARRGADVTASDIDDEAIGTLRLTSDRMGISIKLIACDLFAKIHERFDVVVFNPPYLPSSTIDDRTTDGGERGIEVINRFLSELPQHLAENGRGMLIVSSLNDPERLVTHHPKLSFKTVREKLLFYETLYVLEAEARQPPLVH